MNIFIQADTKFLDLATDIKTHLFILRYRCLIFSALHSVMPYINFAVIACPYLCGQNVAGHLVVQTQSRTLGEHVLIAGS